MATSTLTVSAAFTPTNGVQPTYSSPAVVATPQTVDNYLATTVTVAAAADGALPLTGVFTQVLVQNIDSANYLLIALVGALGGFVPYVLLAPGQIFATSQAVGDSFDPTPNSGYYLHPADFVLRSVDSTGADSATECQVYCYAAI